MTITNSTTPARRDVDGMAVIGRTRHDLMGIRYGEGEGGAGGDAAAIAAAAAAQAATDAAAAADSAPWTKENFDPERAFRLVENLRADAAAAKTKSAADLAAAVDAATTKAVKESNAALAKLLGGGEQEETDPVKLAAKISELTTKVSEQDGNLTAAEAAVKAGQISTQVAILAHGLGASARLLLANEAFKTSIASVEPTDEAALTSAIKAAVQANAALKATPSSSGSDGHQGGQTQALEAQLAAAEKAGDIAQSITLKRRIAAARTS